MDTNKKTRICIVCGNETNVFRKLRCSKCYRLYRYGPGIRKKSHTLYKTCQQCSKTEINLRLIRGMCKTCYNKNRIRQVQLQSKKIPCECGCGQLISSVGKNYRTVRFARGHSSRGNNHPMFGKKHRKDSIVKMKNVNRQEKSKSNTFIEGLIHKELDKLNILFIKQKGLVVKDFIHPVDIFIPPNTCIEIDGDYWHSRILNKSNGLLPIKRDYIIECELEKQGYKVIRFWEYDIKNNFTWVMNQILKLICHNHGLNEYIVCKCGCNQMLKRFNYSGRERQYLHGHHRRKKFQQMYTHICECGCGKEYKNRIKHPKVKYLDGHIFNTNKIITCACGCGLKLVDRNNRYYVRQYLPHHNKRIFNLRHAATNRKCKNCNSMETSILTQKSGRKTPHWYKLNGEYYCLKCYNQIYHIRVRKPRKLNND